MTDLPVGRAPSREAFASIADPEIAFDTPHTAETASRLSAFGASGPRLAVLTGEAGTGKSTMLRRVMEARRCAGDRTMIESLPLGLDDFRARLPGAEPGRDLTVGLDEAQAIPRELLASLGEILEARSDLRLILVGGLALEVTLDELRRRGAPLPAAIHRRLVPFTAGEVGAYVERRWRAAAVEPNPFAPGAVERIAAASEGVPQVINVLCSRLLRLADRTGSARISADMVDAVMADPAHGRPSRRSLHAVAREAPWPWRLAPAAIAAVLIVLLVVLGADRLSDPALRRVERSAPSLAQPDPQHRGDLPRVVRPGRQAASATTDALPAPDPAAARAPASASPPGIAAYVPSPVAPIVPARARASVAADVAGSVPGPVAPTVPTQVAPHEPPAVTRPVPAPSAQSPPSSAAAPPVPTSIAPPAPAAPAPAAIAVLAAPRPVEAAAVPMLPPRTPQVRPLTLVGRRDSAKDDALLRRAEDGDVRAIRALVAEGASAEARDAAGFTPLMLAVIHGHAGAVDALVAAGASVNAQNRAGLTPVMLAAINNHTAVVAALVDRGAELNQRTRAGWTALTYAAWRGHAEAVRLLLARGADPNVTDREGWTVLQYATWRAAEPIPNDDLPEGASGDISRVTGAGQAHREVIALLRQAGVKR